MMHNGTPARGLTALTMAETPTQPSNDRTGKELGTEDALRGWLVDGHKREQRLESTGSTPDPRFTFANERTFLAWNRTALALIASGLAAAQFLRLNPHGLRLVIAVPLIVLGAVLAYASYSHWEDNERAMRLRRALKYSWMPRLLAGGITVIAACGGILAMIDRLVH